jgi:hypothetical protein
MDTEQYTMRQYCASIHIASSETPCSKNYYSRHYQVQPAVSKKNSICRKEKANSLHETTLFMKKHFTRGNRRINPREG